jgi:hypothetical protein
MSIIDRLAVLGSSIGTSLKGKVESAFTERGDGDGDVDNDVDSDGDMASSRVQPALDEATARRRLGLDDACTLLDVRSRAAALARPALASALGNDDNALAALGDIAAAAELLEERLLPLTSPGPERGGDVAQRSRATSRR